MFYTIYRVTNNINKKIYIGVHKTEDLNDGYIGSGVYLNRSINKHGIENFSREIMYIFRSVEEMFDMEEITVNESFVSRDDTYNLKVGGDGGYDYINKCGYNIYGNNGKIGYGGENLHKTIEQQTWRLNPQKYQNFIERLSKTQKEQYSNGRVNGFFGKTHTDETKEKLRMSSSIHQKGEKILNMVNVGYITQD